ncbi:hypothetical protein [Lujinxingia litoralis]|uniref:hypothetical protein n=1 Tax=Lujinxingia litoralis TaxID=2211119 RepID=UPI0018F2D239|nr:hypothetical protein [Lujinxingia litoralis]
MSTQKKEVMDLNHWIREVGAWKSEHRKIRALLAQIDVKLREREHAVEDALWVRAHAIDRNEALGAERLLHRALVSVEREEAELHRRLTRICNELEAVEIERPPAITSAPGASEEAPGRAGEEERLEEAAWESFPASDPPSFNPGRA